MKLTGFYEGPYSYLMPSCRLPPYVPAALCLAALVAGSAQAIAAAENGPWLTALSAKFLVVDLAKGDIDGDGSEETLVCYREGVDVSDQTSGIAVYGGKGTALKPVFHVQLQAICEKVKVSGRKLGVLLAGNKQLVWTYGEDLKFRGDKGSAWSGIAAQASSNTDTTHGAERTIDGDLTSSWAEGSSGTGLGQTLTLKLPLPTDIGMVGIYSGNGSSARAFFDSNRIHRGSLEAKTEADVGDSEAGLDFASLGIDAIGDRLEFACENKPQVTYITVNKRGVVALQVRIDSVYLGDKNDDTHIAEIEVVPMLSMGETLDKATQLKPKLDPPKVGTPDKGATLDKTPGRHDEAVEKLDETGRSVIGDDL